MTTDTGKRTGRRRGHGEGTIYQHATRGWVGQLTTPDGRRKTFYGRTRREVQEKLSAARRDLAQGLPLPNRRLTLQQYLTDWLEQTVKPSTRPRTYRSYADTVRLHIVPALGKYPLDQVTPPRIQALLNAKIAAGQSPRSVTYIRDVLSRALNRAVEWNLLARNPAPLVPAPRGKKRAIVVLTPEQARAFLDHVQGDRLEALYTVALALGMRRGELLGLQWSDVDLDRGTLTVRHQLQRIDGVLRLSEPKSEHGARTLTLPAVVAESLRRHRIRQLEERLLAGPRWQETDHVFTSTVGTALDERNAYRQFQKARAGAGLPAMTLHDLRHSAASLLLAQGVPARMVMELLGHSNISLTLGTYAHIIPQLSRETADKMNAILTGTT